MTVNVLLLGKLYLQGYGQDNVVREKGLPGWFELDLQSGETVQAVIKALRVPTDEVAMTVINGKECDKESNVRDGDHIILIPPDVAALWRYLNALDLDFAIPRREAR